MGGRKDARVNMLVNFLLIFITFHCPIPYLGFWPILKLDIQYTLLNFHSMKNFKDELYFICILYIYFFSDRSFLHDRNLPFNGILKIETKTEQLNTKTKAKSLFFWLDCNVVYRSLW